MSLFRKIFGGGDPLDPLRRAHRQQAWADVLARGASLDPSALDGAAREELERLVREAGDSLAEVNLFEAEASLRGGNRGRAAEHLALAAGQARSEEVLGRISEMRESLGSRPAAAAAAPIAVSLSAQASCCPSGCGSGAHAPVAPREEDIEDSARMELIVTAYPPEWASRYLRLRGPLRQAVLLAHEGLEKEALEAFGHVPVSERDDLFHFERGALLARAGDVEEGRRDLEKALAFRPGHLLAQETLVDLELAAGESGAAETRLLALLGRGEAPAFCHARLAALEASRGNREAALLHGRQALEHGTDPQVLLLTASLLEGAGRMAEAENLLSRFPTGGCGGHNVPLAEFWVRHGKNHEKALAAFQSALRHEPDNPRWRVRIAQVYLAGGRRGEAQALLERALAEPSLDPELHREAGALLDACLSGTTP